MKVYLTLAKQNKSILRKPVPTPYLADDDKEYDEDNEPKGQLQSIAAKVIMKMLYGARMARYDLLHSCQIGDVELRNGQKYATRDYSELFHIFTRTLTSPCLVG